MGAPRPTPHLTRSSLHRCLQRHGISRRPEIEGDKPPKKRFAASAIGYFHLDLAEVRTEDGKLHLFVAVDRTSKLAFAKLEEKATIYTASDFLRARIEAVPYQIHTVLTDNGVPFCDAPKNRSGPTAMLRVHRFDRVGLRARHRASPDQAPPPPRRPAGRRPLRARIEGGARDGPTGRSSA